MGVHGGYNVADSDVFIGLDGHVVASIAEVDVIAALTAELYPFREDATTTVVELGALLPVGVGEVSLYAGPGLALRFDSEQGQGFEADTETRVGLSLKGGVIVGDVERSFRPFVEVDQQLGIGTTVSVRAGVFFTLGDR